MGLDSILFKRKKEFTRGAGEVLVSGIEANRYHYVAKRMRNGSASKEMNLDGLTISQADSEFSFGPAPGELLLLDYVGLTLIDNGTFAGGVFGSLVGALANGLVLKSQLNSVVRTITTLVDNRDIFDCFTGQQGIPAPGGNVGVFESGDWLGGRMQFPRRIFMDGDKGDRVFFEIQDDLTGIDSLTAAVLAFEVQEIED